MVIPIDDKWRIGSDQYQFILQRRRIVKGETVWENITYHTRLENLIMELANRELRAADVITLAGALEKIESLATALSHAHNNPFKGAT